MKRKTQPAIAFVKPPPFRDAMKRVTKELRCDNPTCDCVGDLFYAKAEVTRLKRRLKVLRQALADIGGGVQPTETQAEWTRAVLAADTRAARRRK